VRIRDIQESLMDNYWWIINHLGWTTCAWNGRFCFASRNSVLLTFDNQVVRGEYANLCHNLKLYGLLLKLPLEIRHWNEVYIMDIVSHCLHSQLIVGMTCFLTVLTTLISVKLLFQGIWATAVSGVLSLTEGQWTPMDASHGVSFSEPLLPLSPHWPHL
jgi:hypothetical protein